MTPAEFLKQWQAKFSILKDWDIQIVPVNELRGHAAKITVHPELPKANLFPWPNKDVPPDFYLHEVLHAALRAYKRLPVEADFDEEEQLVRNICKIWREASPEQIVVSSVCSTLKVSPAITPLVVPQLSIDELEVALIDESEGDNVNP